MFVALSGSPVVGFAGSRSGAGAAAASVLAAACAAAGVPVFASCGRGAPAAALAAAGPLGRCFSVSSVPSSVPVRARFALRAQAFVRELAAVPGAALLAWPGAPAPGGLRPLRSWQSCGSGTWSEVALACGLGVAVFVFAPRAWLPGAAFGGGWGGGVAELSGSWLWSAPESVAPPPGQLPLL